MSSYYQQVWNKRDFRLLPYLFADRCKVNYMNNGSVNSIICSPDDIKENIEKWIRIFPDIKLNIITLIGDNQYVSAYYKVQGTHLGEWKNIQPAKKFVEIEIMSMYKIERGKICEEWINTDVVDEVLKQITTADSSSYILTSN